MEKAVAKDSLPIAWAAVQGQGCKTEADQRMKNNGKERLMSTVLSSSCWLNITKYSTLFGCKWQKPNLTDWPETEILASLVQRCFRKHGGDEVT